jgi:hypothetical protein
MAKGPSKSAPPSGAVAVVQRFNDAFNRHDGDADERRVAFPAAHKPGRFLA